MTFCESFDGIILLFRLIYTGKTERSLPNVDFLQRLCVAFNEKHWSNETETICIINNVLVPKDLVKIPYRISYGPKNMTHLLQLLDLTINTAFKKYEKRAFSDYC